MIWSCVVVTLVSGTDLGSSNHFLGQWRLGHQRWPVTVLIRCSALKTTRCQANTGCLATGLETFQRRASLLFRHSPRSKPHCEASRPVSRLTPRIQGVTCDLLPASLFGLHPTHISPRLEVLSSWLDVWPPLAMYLLGQLHELRPQWSRRDKVSRPVRKVYPRFAPSRTLLVVWRVGGGGGGRDELQPIADSVRLGCFSMDFSSHVF